MLVLREGVHYSSLDGDGPVDRNVIEDDITRKIT